MKKLYYSYFCITLIAIISPINMYPRYFNIGYVNAKYSDTDKLLISAALTSIISITTWKIYSCVAVWKLNNSKQYTETIKTNLLNIQQTYTLLNLIAEEDPTQQQLERFAQQLQMPLPEVMSNILESIKKLTKYTIFIDNRECWKSKKHYKELYKELAHIKPELAATIDTLNALSSFITNNLSYFFLKKEYDTCKEIFKKELLAVGFPVQEFPNQEIVKNNELTTVIQERYMATGELYCYITFAQSLVAHITLLEKRKKEISYNNLYNSLIEKTEKLLKFLEQIKTSIIPFYAEQQKKQILYDQTERLIAAQEEQNRIYQSQVKEERRKNSLINQHVHIHTKTY